MLRRVLISLIGVGVLAGSLGAARAALTATTVNPANSITTNATFPYPINVSAWDINDQANGSNTDRSPYWAFTDSRTYDFGGTYTTHDATKYGRYDFGAPLKTALAVSSATLNVRLLVGDSSDAGCFWVNVRRRSDQVSLATYNNGGAGWCTTSTSGVNHSISLPILDTTTEANDVTVRLEGWYEDSTNNTSNDWYIDSVTLSVVTTPGTHTLYPDYFADVTDGNASNGGTGGVCALSQSGSNSEGNWGIIDTGDSACLYSNASWATTSYNSARYIDFAIAPNSVPTTATVTAATLTHGWRPLSANSTCYFVETRYAGAAIGTYGSSGSPLACSSATGSTSTQTQVLAEVNTAARANGLTIRLYYWATASTSTRHDYFNVEIKYY